MDGPDQETERKGDRSKRVQRSNPLKIEQAFPACRHLSFDGPVEAAMLSGEATKSLDQRDIADDVDHFPVDCGCFIPKLVMQRSAGGCKPKQAHDESTTNTN